MSNASTERSASHSVINAILLFSRLPHWAGWLHRWGVSAVTFWHTLSPPAHLERIYFQFLISFSLPLFPAVPPPRCPLLGQLKCSCRSQSSIIRPAGLSRAAAEEESSGKKERKAWDDILAFLGSRGCSRGLLEQVLPSFFFPINSSTSLSKIIQ